MKRFFTKSLLWQLPLVLIYALAFGEVYLRLFGCRWFFRVHEEFTSLPYSFVAAPPEKVDLLEPHNYRLVEGTPRKIVSMTGDGLRWPSHDGQHASFLIVGGSTTFAEAQDDSMAWPYLTARDV